MSVFVSFEDLLKDWTWACKDHSVSLHLLAIFTGQMTSVKSSSVLRLPNEAVMFSLKSLHCKQSFSDILQASGDSIIKLVLTRSLQCHPYLCICVYIYVSICNWRILLIPSKIFPELICIFSSQCSYLAQSECYALMTNNSKAHPCFPRFLLVNFLCAWLWPLCSPGSFCVTKGCHHIFSVCQFIFFFIA